jgi:hypothetical protein
MRDNLTETIKGVAALCEALNVIGSHKTDHDMAKIICDGELELRALIAFALKSLAQD